MNNKGQSLVTFILLIPIIFMIFMMVYNIGNMILLKQKLDNISYLTIDYGLDKMDTDKMKEIILINDQDIIIKDIRIENEKIYLSLEESIDLKILGDLITVKSNYVGYLEDDKRIIERDK